MWYTYWTLYNIPLYDCYTEQEALTFSDEQIKKFKTRLENEYDLQLDPRYNLWLSSQTAANGQSTDNSVKNNDKSKNFKSLNV